MKATLVAVDALEQLQELFCLAKMVPGCFCCLTACWQGPPFWVLLMVVLLNTEGVRGDWQAPGSGMWGIPMGQQGIPPPQPGAGTAGRQWGQPPGDRDRTRPGWGVSPRVGLAQQGPWPGRAVGRQNPALLWCCWGRGWCPQGFWAMGRVETSGGGVRDSWGWQDPQGPASSSTHGPQTSRWTHLLAPCWSCSKQRTSLSAFSSS